jgi:hypothetical protein
MTAVTASQSPTTARSDTLANSTTVTNSRSLTQPVGTAPAASAAGRPADAGADATVDAAADAGAAPPAELTLTNAVSRTVSPATTFTTSLTLTNAVTQADALTLTHVEAEALTRSLTAIDGRLKVPAIIENRSDRAFIVANLILGATLLDPSGAVIAVQNLVLDQGGYVVFAPFSLAPWEQSDPTIFTTIPLSLEMARAIVFSGARLDIRIAVYEIADAMGKPFSFDVEAIQQKTALVAIDYGNKLSPELYQVATNADPDHPGVKASAILRQILRIPFEADTSSGLTSVRDMTVSSSGGPRWSVSLRHTEGPVAFDTVYGSDGAPYDLGDIEVQAGDVLRLSLEPGGAAMSDASFAQPPLAAATTIDSGLQVVFDATVVGAPSLSSVSIAPSSVPPPPAATVAPSAASPAAPTPVGSSQGGPPVNDP